MFKVGDKVYCALLGHGVVKKVSADNQDDFPVSVDFGDFTDNYTLDGKLYKKYNPSLSFTEYTLQGFTQEKPIQLPEVGELCLVRDSDDDCWRAVKFRGYEPKSIMRYITEHGFAYKQIKRIKILD